MVSGAYSWAKLWILRMRGFPFSCVISHGLSPWRRFAEGWILESCCQMGAGRSCIKQRVRSRNERRDAKQQEKQETELRTRSRRSSSLPRCCRRAAAPQDRNEKAGTVMYDAQELRATHPGSV